MIFKKPRKHPAVDQQQLRIAFARMAEGAQSIVLKLNKDEVRARVIDEVEGSLYIQFKQELRERYNIRVNIGIAITFYYEGKEHYGKMLVQGVGRYEKQDAMRLAIPDVLYINDNFGLTEFNVTPRRDLTFTSMFNEFCTGSLVNIGPSGVDMTSKEGGTTKELLVVDTKTDLGFELPDGLRVATKGRVLYINEVGEELIGIRFEGIDPETEKAIGDWIRDQTAKKREADISFMRNRLLGGKKRRPQQETSTEKVFKPAHDFPTVLHPGDPQILLLCRDHHLLLRMGKALKRKYGVLISKGRFKNVVEILEHFSPKLVVVHDTLDTISGFDLCQTFCEQIPDMPPMVLVGEADDVAASQNKAISVGALDYWSLNPFHPLSFFKHVQESLALFETEEESEAQAEDEKANND